MRDFIYLIIDEHGVQRIAHTTDGLLRASERMLPLQVHVPNSWFNRILPPLKLDVPDDDLLAHTAIEITATPIPTQEIA
jgi:hypothetical protein